MDADLREELKKLFQRGYFLEAKQASLRALNPVDVLPGWVDDELREALEAIEEPHVRKKRTTVLRLAEAKASGLSVNEVFNSEDCCSGPIWYGRHSPRRIIGWADREDIRGAYELALRKAHAYYDSLEEQRQYVRRHILEDTTDRLAELSRAAVEVLWDIMLDDGAAGDVRRKAAVDILTHAAPETAPKSQTEQRMEVAVSTSGPAMRDIRHRGRQLPDRVVDHEHDTAPQAHEGDGPPPPPRGGLRVKPGLYEAPLVSDNGHDEDEEIESSL